MEGVQVFSLSYYKILMALFWLLGLALVTTILGIGRAALFGLAAPRRLVRQIAFLHPGRLFWQKLHYDNLAFIHTRTPSLWIVLWLELPPGLLLLIQELESIARMLIPVGHVYSQMQLSLQPTGHWLDLIGIIVGLGLLIPLCEEILFHGYGLGLLTRLTAKQDRPGLTFFIGLIWLNLLFALSFMNTWQPLYMFGLGLVLSYIRLICGSLYPVLIVRLSTNALQLMLFYLNQDWLDWIKPNPNSGPQHLPWIFIVVGLILVGNACYYLYKRSRLLGLRPGI